MKRKKTDAPFDLRDPIVPEVRGKTPRLRGKRCAQGM